MNKEDFIKSWTALINSVKKLASITEANRRLLAGITAALISKGVMSADEIASIEKDVKKGLKKKKRRR